ncbi:hypothetical protein KI387_039935, partial [Taxus chinensis]
MEEPKEKRQNTPDASSPKAFLEEREVKYATTFKVELEEELEGQEAEVETMFDVGEDMAR